MRTFAILAYTFIAGAGCATLLLPAAEKAADAIVDYCTLETFEARQIYRNTISAELPPGYAVAVTCPGDPEPTP